MRTIVLVALILTQICIASNNTESRADSTKAVDFTKSTDNPQATQPAIPKPKDGFSANLMLGGGVRFVKSNISLLSVWGKSTPLKSYAGGDSNLSGIALSGVELAYRFTDSGGANHHFFLKNYYARNLGGLGIGYEATYAQNHTTSVVFISALRQKIYENPYALGERNLSNQYLNGLRLTQGYKFNARHSLKFHYTGIFKTINRDKVPHSDLRRKGDIHQFELEYAYLMLSANLYYDFHNIRGKAQAYNAYGAGLKAFVPLGSVVIAPNLSLERQHFMASDPIFMRKRATFALKTGLTMMFNNIIFEGAYIFATYNFELKDSNIGFYDERFHTAIAGIGYRF